MLTEFLQELGGVLISAKAIWFSVLYVLGGMAIIWPPYNRDYKLSIFALYNLALTYWFFFSGSDAMIWRFLAYMLFGCFHFAMLSLMMRNSKPSKLFYWLVFALPLVFLLAIKVEGIAFFGFSYMAFRLSYMAFEAQSKRIAPVSISEYFAFAFFLPTMSIGPISPISLFQSSFGRPGSINAGNIYQGMMRVFIGIIKFALLAPLAQQLSYTNLFLDGLQHGWVDFFIAGFAYLLFLYLNFAGFCDIVIGAAALMGIRLKENFDNPLLSRSIVDFWNRWHITLSEYVRDVFYTPISMNLTRRFGFTLYPLWVIIAAALTFIIVGYWHGTAIGFLIFGLMHGLGFSVNVIYGLMLDKRPKLKKRLNTNIPYRVVCIIVTILYVSASVFFFENNTQEQIDTMVIVMRDSGMF